MSEEPKPAKISRKERPVQPERGPPKQQKAAQIIRFVETNVDATGTALNGIRNVRGIGHVMANAIVNKMGLRGKRLNELSEAELASLEQAVYNPAGIGIPIWMLNRRKDWYDGADRHFVASKLELSVKTDINLMKKMRTHKGIRHGLGLPVRGQRTRSSFRKGTIVGVTRKKAEPGKAAPEKEKGEKQ